PWGRGRRVRAAMQRYGRRWGESITSLAMLQWSALVAVAEGAEIDQRRLGECLRLDKATASVMVSRLSRRGLLERGEDDGDRRRRILHLTRAGRDEPGAVYALVPAVVEGFPAPDPGAGAGG